MLPADPKESQASTALTVVAASALVVGVWARLYRLGFPPFEVWDEIYFPVHASDYLRGVPFFDHHPPLGKFILAIGIVLFGDTPLGWRLMPALFGCASIGLGAAVGWRYTGERAGALLLALFVACETMFVVYSRTGIMDGILVFFVLATFLAALWAGTRKQVIGVGVLLGLTISIKWAALMVAVPAGYVLWRKGLLGSFFGGLYLSLIVYLGIVYVGQLVNPTGAGTQFVEARGLGLLWNRWVLVWEWHLQALDNLARALPNTESSPWWGWPLMLKPIAFARFADRGGNLFYILAIGNPLLWWSSTLAVLTSAGTLAWRKLVSRETIADDPLVPALLGYVFLILLWVPRTRNPFLYNYFPAYTFALLALTAWLCRLWRRSPWGPWTVVVFAALVVGAGIFFLPVAMALPTSPEAFQRRIWLDSWL